MKKLLAFSLAMLFLGVGIASATDFSISGSYFVRGTYNDNTQAEPQSDAKTFSDYDHELSISPVFKIDDSTKVTMRIEIRDETWQGDSDPDRVDEGPSPADSDNDDNIVIERLWGTHVFGNGTKLDVGIMTGGGWGTPFADNVGDKYRVKITQPTSMGTFIAFAEKDREEGSSLIGEDEDQDTYVLAMISKIGDVNVKPFVAYTIDKDSSRNETDRYEADIITSFLAFDGISGKFGWEAEGAVRDINYESATGLGAKTDATVFGLYGNLWMNMNQLKVGALAAYGSYDDDAEVGFDFGEDFEAGGALMMGDEIMLSDATDDGNHGLIGATLVALYADYKMNDKLSVGGYAGYAFSNIDDSVAAAKWEDSDLYEVSADLTYDITANLSYWVAAGVAQLGFDDDPDPDRSVKVEHKLTFNF